MALFIHARSWRGADRPLRLGADCPPELLRLLEGARFAAAGSYAYVFVTATRAVKFTTDAATIALARTLKAHPCPALPRVYLVHERAAYCQRSRRWLTAVCTERLWPLARTEQATVQAMYSQAARAARVFRAKGAPARSLVILTALLRSNAPNPRLRRGLLRLRRFVRRTRYSIDLCVRTNWMRNRRGQLVLSDPVVWRAFQF